MFCGCCNSSDDSEPSARTPLLIDDPSKPVVRQPVSARGGGTLTGQWGQSGRVGSDHTDVLDTPGLTKIGKLVIKKTKVSHVDKTLQDHVELYNNHYDRFMDIQAYIEELCGAFSEDNAEHSLQRTMVIIGERAKCKVELQRKHKHCIKLLYDERFTSREVLSEVRTFNKANKLIKEVLEKGPAISNSVNLVLKDERKLRRDVLASSLGMDGPESMKHCLEAIAKLRHVPGFVEEIESETKSFFRQLVKVSQVFCQEDSIADKTDFQVNDENCNVKT